MRQKSTLRITEFLCRNCEMALTLRVTSHMNNHAKLIGHAVCICVSILKEMVAFRLIHI